MNAISYTELRSNPKRIMDMVCDTHEPVIILRKDGEKTVMLSYADYSAIQETSYLLGSPKMAERLRESIESFHKGTGVERALIEDE
jgi:antitoxin YefM